METSNISPGPERRKKRRVVVTRPVLLKHKKLGQHAGWLRDVSLDGVFVESDWKDLPIFTPIEVNVSLENSETNQVHEFQIPTTVTRLTPTGLGLRFDMFDKKSYSALLDVIY